MTKEQERAELHRVIWQIANDLRAKIDAIVADLEGSGIMSKVDLLITLLQEAVDKCYANDNTLIDRSMEQASVARIFYYIQRAIDTDDRFEQFREYNLDCEYNKDKNKIKSTPRCKQGTRPDLVLHKRWNTKKPYTPDNILVVEFKPRKARYKKFANTGKYIDFIKLEDFTHMDCYNYF